MPTFRTPSPHKSAHSSRLSDDFDSSRQLLTDTGNHLFVGFNKQLWLDTLKDPTGRRFTTDQADHIGCATGHQTGSTANNGGKKSGLNGSPSGPRCYRWANNASSTKP